MKDTIKSMLLENTGKHFLDSGGDSGRHWQRNQHRDFESEPPITIEADIHHDAMGNITFSDVIATLSLYHWLLGANIEEDERCEEFQSTIDNDDPFAEGYITSRCWELLYSWGAKPKGDTYYTYNDSDNLDQSFVHRYFEIDGYDYVLISVHGGADARGGFAAARLFYIHDELIYNEGWSRFTDEEEVTDHVRWGEPYRLTRYFDGAKHVIPQCTDLKYID